MNAKQKQDILDVLELVTSTASQEWQESDGRRMAATDNAGNRLWFISDDVMQEVRTVLAESIGA